MQILKKILFALVGVIVLLLVVAIFLPSEYKVSRSIEINQPDSVVFEKVVNYNHRASWDPWISMDPEAKTTISGPVGEPGSTWSWEGKETGKGRMTILKVEDNQLIQSKLEFLEPQTGESDITWMFKPAAGGTQVTWQFSGTADYPIGRYFGLFMDSMVGPDFQRGLNNLKKVCEE
jgi:uncharacterized protein YndB with AHSA1/START domain